MSVPGNREIAALKAQNLWLQLGHSAPRIADRLIMSWPELIAMVQRIVGHRNPIPRSAAIYQDLQFTGDDAYELFEMISARFGTSFQGFDWPAYFPNETEVGPLSYWAAYRAAKFDS